MFPYNQRCHAQPLIPSVLKYLSSGQRFTFIPKFPNCLCGISTRQLELLLWRAGPTAQHTQDSRIFFIQLNYVYNRKE